LFWLHVVSCCILICGWIVYKELHVFFSDPDPVGLTVDQEKGGSGGSGGAGEGGGAGGSVQEETGPTGIVVPASTAVPIELVLQAEEAALVGLKLVEKGHVGGLAPYAYIIP